MRKFLPAALIFIIVYLISTYAYPYEYQENSSPNPMYPIRQTIIENSSKGSLKLVIVGDSLMAGVGTSGKTKALSYSVAKEFARVQNSNVELIDLATPGSGVEDVLQNQLPEAIKEKPDFVLVMIGVNDVHNLKSAEYFKDNYGRIVSALSTRTEAKVTLINIPYLGSDKIVLPPWNLLLDLRTTEFNDIIRQLSGKAKLIDLYGKFKTQFQKSSNLYSKDQFHPSDLGYAEWAGYINANLSR